MYMHYTYPTTCSATGEPEEDAEREMHFLIKWKNWSHLHSTWESHKSIVDGKSECAGTLCGMIICSSVSY